MTATVAAVLRRAAERVRQGWCQGTWVRANDGKQVCLGDPAVSRYCPMGAVRTELGLLKCEDEFQLHWTMPLCRMVGDVVQWNDAPERTQDEVVAMMLTAAGAAERES